MVPSVASQISSQAFAPQPRDPPGNGRKLYFGGNDDKDAQPRDNGSRSRSRIGPRQPTPDPWPRDPGNGKLSYAIRYSSKRSKPQPRDDEDGSNRSYRSKRSDPQPRDPPSGRVAVGEGVHQNYVFELPLRLMSREPKNPWPRDPPGTGRSWTGSDEVCLGGSIQSKFFVFFSGKPAKGISTNGPIPRGPATHHLLI